MNILTLPLQAQAPAQGSGMASMWIRLSPFWKKFLLNPPNMRRPCA